MSDNTRLDAGSGGDLIRTIDTGSVKIPAGVLVNSTGTEVGTASAPLRVDPTGTTPQPVSGSVSVTGTATVAGSVTVSSSALPTGAATAAAQATGNASAASLDGKVTACNTGAVTVAASALPTGAATAAAQATGNASLASLDGKLPALSGGRVPVDVGALSLSGAVDQGAGGVSAWKVDGSAATQPVSAVALPLPSGAATQATLAALDAKVTTCDTGAVTVASCALPTGAATSAKQDAGNGSLATIATAQDAAASTRASEATLAGLSGKVTAVDTGAVVVSSSALPTGGATSAKQDTGNTSLASILTGLGSLATQTTLAAVNTLLGGGLPAALGTAGGLKASLVDIGTAATDTVLQAVRDRLPTSLGAQAAGSSLSIVPATSTAFPVSDNGNSLTVDAPVGTPAFVRLSDGSSAITTLPVSLASLPALAAGTNNIGDVDVLSLPTLPTGTNVIGKVGIQVGVADVAPTNPVHVASTNVSIGHKFGSTATGVWLIYDGPCTLFGADVIVNAYGSTANLLLVDSVTPPTATQVTVEDATAIIAVVQAATNSTATRTYAAGRKITNKLYAVLSSSNTTITFMHASTDSGRVVIDYRA